jgi:hypothetical protein
MRVQRVRATDVGRRTLVDRDGITGWELREATRRSVDGRTAPHRTLGWRVSQAGVGSGWDDEQTRDQPAPFLDLHRFEGMRSGRNEGEPAASGAGAGTGFTRGNRVLPWNSGAIRRRFDMINGRPLDMSRVVATGPHGRGEQEDDAQECQRHSGPETKQASHGNTHQARPTTKRRIIPTRVGARHPMSNEVDDTACPGAIQGKSRIGRG